MGAQLTAAKRIAEIKARAESSTPGPWGFGSYDGRYSIGQMTPVYVYDWSVAHHVCCRVDDETGRDCSGCGPIKKNDAHFIAAARTDIPWLLKRLERAEQLLREWRDVEDPNMAMAIEADAEAFLAGEDE